MNVAADSVTLHSSWRGIVTSGIGASVVLVAGVIVVVSVGWRLLPTLTLVAGACFTLVALLDYPIASELDARGVTRRAVLRRHRLPWAQVDQLTRARPGVVVHVRGLEPGGLVAKVGRRRYLLVDQCESRAEFDALERVLGDTATAVRFDRLVIPPANVGPTWTYRRRKWADHSVSES